MEKIKTFDELTIQDNFLFQHVMRNERLCTHLIEKILNIKVQSLHKGLPIYTFTHCCKEDNKVQLKDEETRMFLNRKGSENAADPDIAAFLRYIDGKAAEGHFVESLDQEVHLVKSMDKVRREYMILSDEIRRRQKEAEEEGMKKGLEKGLEKGMAKGVEKERRQLLLNLLESGLSMEQVAAGTKVPVEYVRKLAEEMVFEVSERCQGF